MKKRSLKDLRLKSDKELSKILYERKDTLAKAQLEIKVSKEKNLKKAKNLKKDVAQIFTVIQEKKIIDKISEKGVK